MLFATIRSDAPSEFSAVHISGDELIGDFYSLFWWQPAVRFLSIEHNGLEMQLNSQNFPKCLATDKQVVHYCNNQLVDIQYSR